MAESEGIETRDNERAGAGSLAAFTIFRFEWDDDEEPEYLCSTAMNSKYTLPFKVEGLVES